MTKKILMFVLAMLFSTIAFAQGENELSDSRKSWLSRPCTGDAAFLVPQCGGAADDFIVNNLGLRTNATRVPCFARGDANCSMFTVPGPGGIWEVRVRDGNGANLADVELLNAAGTIATDIGMWVKSALHGLGLTSGTEVLNDLIETHADDIPNTANGIVTGSFTYGYYEQDDIWTRARVQEYIAAMPQPAVQDTIIGIEVLNFPYFWDLSTAGAVRWDGNAASNDTLAGTLVAPYVINFQYGWNGTNWQRVDVDTNGSLTVNQTTATPGYNRIQDGDSTTLADVIDTFADNLATTLNGVMTGSVMYAYDGATLDMLRVGAVGELQVTDVASRPGEDAANDWRKTAKYYSQPYTPAKTTTATIGTAAVNIYASTEMITWPDWTVYVKNTDGADPFVDLDIEGSPDGSSWLELTAAGHGVITDCVDNLGSGVMCMMVCRNCSIRYVRVQAAAADANQASSDVWITANRN